MEEFDEIKIYSDEVRDILSDPPKAIYRWGNTILLGFVVLLFLMSWFISYPDIVSTQIIITTNLPPEKLIAKTSGKIETILVKDRTLVKKNTPLAVIENTSNYKDVFLLKSIIDTINLERNDFPFHLFKSAQFGDVENAYGFFQKEYSTDQLNRELQPYKVEGTAHILESIQLKERLNLLESQKSITQNELALEKLDLDRYQTLYNKGIVASQELEKHKLTFLQSEKGYKNLLSTISSLKSSINELNRNSKTTQINESKESVNLERNVMQAFFQLKKAVKDWELNYVFRSSIDGKVTFLQVWNENQFVNLGDNIFSIVPTIESGYIGKVKASAQNSGKIKIGQNVNIRLANFPDREFGIINGKVKNISLIPDKEGNLLIDIALPKGIETSYKKKISFQQEMIGSADIVTEDLRLLERLLYQFRDLFKR
ncbi:HlyD family efflux transporter periplasmic adaptor subunit [Flavobacterium sp.]|uniref:HlyD family secretion protein n=1 Tax=Flavobacterium sp. TaxID=239 RepID=UPI000EDFAADF|nr:HlyD family efflux transporter periplasmic adaptor subunit [Flavobacterium sp.]HCQ12733.1 HlyD family secretion protein [Flavobacterium sp.]